MSSRRTRHLAILLVMAACSEEVPPDAGSRDAGFRDGGRIRRDAGFVDAGQLPVCGDGVCHDGRFGTVDLGERCIDCQLDCSCHSQGFEGYVCNSSFEIGDTAFARDDCDDDLLCVPFDLLSGRWDLNGPVQNCVRPCETDAECGVTDRGDQRVCTDGMEILSSTVAIGRICVDRLGEPDEYCGASRNTTPKIPDVTIRTQEDMVGCEGDAVCAFGFLRDMMPDEGVCLQFCDEPGAPPCAAETPYCNPNVLGRSVCSDAENGVGSWCGIMNRDNAGLANHCDTSTNTVGRVECFDIGDDELGLCLERCDTSTSTPKACESIDPTNGPRYCVDDFCASPDCGRFPDTCDGPGARGYGRLCLMILDEVEGICVDRLGPSWNPGAVSSDAQMFHRDGDDCRDPSDRLAFARCPEPTTCFDRTPGGGSCLVGCARTSTGADAACGVTLDALGLPSADATCAEPSPAWDPMFGICGGD